MWKAAFKKFEVICSAWADHTLPLGTLPLYLQPQNKFHFSIFPVLNAAHLYFETSLASVTLREKCPNTGFFLVRIWTLFTQCEMKGFPRKDSGNYKQIPGRKNNYLIFVMVFFPSSNWYRLMVVVHLIKKFPWTYYLMLV